MANQPFISPTPGYITIAAITPCIQFSAYKEDSDEKYEYYLPSLSDFEKLSQCGFNAVCLNTITNLYYNSVINAVGYATQNNLKVILTQGTSNSVMLTYCKNLSSNNNVTSFKIKDEPTWDDISIANNDFKSIYKSLTSLYLNRTTFFNLIGSLQPAYAGILNSYPSYLRFIQQTFEPGLWCFDLYPVRYASNGQLEVIKDAFYARLEDFLNISKDTGRPFFSTVLCVQFYNNIIKYPLPTEAYMTYAAFSALAMGAKGIIYWHYALRESDKETYQMAPINRNGQTTSIWYDVQKVNQKIKTYSHVFVNSTVELYKFCSSKVVTTFNIGPVNRVTCLGDGALVSVLKNTGGSTFMVIVNSSPFNSQLITVTLNPGSVTAFPLTSNAQTGNSAINIGLAAGDFAIIAW